MSGLCVLALAGIMTIMSCSGGTSPADTTTVPATTAKRAGEVLIPIVITEPVGKDSDDPAIWLNPDDPAQSLILGTDKGGSIYAFDLNGRIIPDKTVTGMGRINNIDVEYGFVLGGVPTDIAVATDRNGNLIRIFRLPEMTPIDNGGIEAFEGQTPELRRPMGLTLYKRSSDGALFAVVSRKAGPSGGYLWQYLIEDDGAGAVKFTKVREFGAVSDGGEIEAVVVDDELGYIYYCDENAGIRKYLADPDAPAAAEELAIFGTEGFLEDREGISIYEINNGTGYIIVSDQAANQFHIFPRDGEPGNPHSHPQIKVVRTSTNNSDGNDVTTAVVDERFPSGLFVAMSDDGTFQYYSWDDIAGNDLRKAPGGVVP